MIKVNQVVSRGEYLVSGFHRNLNYEYSSLVGKDVDANKIIPIGYIFDFFEITPEDDLRISDTLCARTRYFRAWLQLVIAIAASVCTSTPVTAFRRCIVEFLFRHAILISDVREKESETAEVDVPRKRPRTCYMISSGRTRLVYKNLLLLTRRFISI